MSRQAKVGVIRITVTDSTPESLLRNVLMQAAQRVMGGEQSKGEIGVQSCQVWLEGWKEDPV